MLPNPSVLSFALSGAWAGYLVGVFSADLFARCSADNIDVCMEWAHTDYGLDGAVVGAVIGIGACLLERDVMRRLRSL